MHGLSVVILILSFLYQSALNAANPIVVISIDGLRPDAIKKAKAKTLQNLIKTGTSFSNARTVRPSITLPSHTSMLTGLDPEHHGITWNDYRADYGPVRFPTALEIANNAGLDTAMFVTKEKLLHLKRPNGVDYFEKTTDTEGKLAAEAFVKYLKTHELPDVTFIHIPNPDITGHRLMWNSPFYLSAVEDADEFVGIILKAAQSKSPGKRITSIISADHGGFGFGHLANIDVNNTIPFIVNGDNIAANVVKATPVRIFDVAATVLHLLGLEVPETWQGSPAPILIEPRLSSILHLPPVMSI